MASEVAPGRQELPLLMRLSLWSGWGGEQLVCPKSLGWRAELGEDYTFIGILVEATKGIDLIVPAIRNRGIDQASRSRDCLT